jgi:hypothetical protein
MSTFYFCTSASMCNRQRTCSPLATTVLVRRMDNAPTPFRSDADSSEAAPTFANCSTMAGASRYPTNLESGTPRTSHRYVGAYCSSVISVKLHTKCMSMMAWAARALKTWSQKPVPWPPCTATCRPVAWVGLHTNANFLSNIFENILYLTYYI